MNSETLINKLFISNARANWYSIDGELKPDAWILNKNYSTWEVFYLDEKGNQSNYKVFPNDEDAYDFLWSKIEYLLGFYKVIPKSS